MNDIPKLLYYVIFPILDIIINPQLNKKHVQNLYTMKKEVLTN